MLYHDFLIETEEDIATLNVQLEKHFFRTGILGLLGREGQPTLKGGYPVVRVFGAADADHFERTAQFVCSCRIVRRLPPGDEADIFREFFRKGSP